jgi:hypothetical protein
MLYIVIELLNSYLVFDKTYIKFLQMDCKEFKISRNWYMQDGGQTPYEDGRMLETQRH